MNTRSAFFLLAVLASIAAGGCIPAPRAYRIFLPSHPSQPGTEERLQDLQARCESGRMTPEECSCKREELLSLTR